MFAQLELEVMGFPMAIKKNKVLINVRKVCAELLKIDNISHSHHLSPVHPSIHNMSAKLKPFAVHDLSVWRCLEPRRMQRVLLENSPSDFEAANSAVSSSLLETLILLHSLQ